MKVKHLYRDSQRDKVYESEYFLRPNSKTFTSVDEIQKYVTKIVKSAWAQRNFNLPKVWFDGRINPVIVKETKATRFARAGYSVIKVTTSNGSRWSWCVPVILHELAHVLDNHRKDNVLHLKDNRAHGWQFTKTFLELVAKYMSKDLAKQLKAEYKKRGVKHTVPRQRKPLTEEQRNVLRERVAAARAKKTANTWEYGTYEYIADTVYQVKGTADTRKAAYDKAVMFTLEGQKTPFIRRVGKRAEVLDFYNAKRAANAIRFNEDRQRQREAATTTGTMELETLFRII